MTSLRYKNDITMTSFSTQRDLINTKKRETLSNVWLLSKIQPMSLDLSRLLKENQLEKPTQNLFNHLAYYLVSIIDPQVTLPWPLYDTKTERTYRNKLSVFITEYSKKGLLSPVISSYLVNPGCYKVISLMFQLSKLAVQRTILKIMKKDSQKTRYQDMTQLYETREVKFIETVEREIRVMSNKLTNHLEKRKTLEEHAKKLGDFITQKEAAQKATKAQELINNLVDRYLETQDFDEETKSEILEIKNVHKQAKYFDNWLEKLDCRITEMESQWDSKMSPFLKLSQTTYENTETLIARQTGEADKRTFMIEYNPEIDNINIDELVKQANTEQKYILKNIVRDDRLNFPNLIRGYLISICFVFKNVEIGDEIFQFNECLDEGRRSYAEVVQAMRTLLERIRNADSRIQHRQETFTNSMLVSELSEIPPLPNLTDLKMNKEFLFQTQVFGNPFTPLNLKHLCNLRKQKSGSLVKPVINIVTPYHHALKEDLFKGFNSFRISVNHSTIQNTLNESVISQIRGNETIAECTSGITKQQLARLLSTKKSSNRKKFKHTIEKRNIKIKKGNLFNESFFNESNCIFRSHSSPNLFEKRPQSRSRKLPTMKEGSPSFLEVSGIAAIERDSNHSTPQGMLESTRKLIDSASLPSISMNVTPRSDMSDNIEADLNKEIEFKAPQMLPQRRSRETCEDKPVLPFRKSKLPQPMNKKYVNQYLFVPQSYPSGYSEKLQGEQMVQPQRKSKEVFEEEILLTQSPKIFEENSQTERKSGEFREIKTETPKTNPPIVKKTSSLEKIINRFKKVRASMNPTPRTYLPTEHFEENNDIKTISEEKENLNSVNVDVFTANRNLLPDLVSPNGNMPSKYNNNDILVALNFDSGDEDSINKPRRLRESLGTALGVDHTFLDQFDLSD